MLISYLFENPLLFIMVAGALILSLSLHEFAHAFVADKLGDPTARYLGRVSLDPRAHIDPIGMIMLLFAGIGWGRPVPFNPINLKNPKRDAALISLAGPASNLIVAVLLSFILKGVPGLGILSMFLYLCVVYNLMLGFFNLIPFHPLDGFKIVGGFLPDNLAIQWEQMRQYGMFILMFLVLSGSTGMLIDPFFDFSMRLLGLQ